ncbi:class I SAM-dependent methyltransferase [Fulvimarina sp. MAC3]|uniref:class I SAM-dependent methyltransferase n=1 Tax=Fulvimarina sp. MAC3 TaxID=3148887 RepID=UPI0031FBFC23
MEWLDGRGPERHCPACHATGETHRVLKIRSALPPQEELTLERCAACGSAFFPGFEEPAYETVWGGDAALSFYQEQGAGIDVMLASLYAVPHENIERFLEIGCGFGFSVDFAARVLGWKAHGIDPGPAARLGRDLLGASIDGAYLSLENAEERESVDLMLCSEVIEHIADPDPFLAVLAAHLTETGTVLLTTPNGDAVRPDTSPATLAPLLSAGYHVILFSPKGLEAALRRAGFEGVVVADWGHSLRAAASRKHCDADFTRPLDRTAYRDYLERVASSAEKASALSLGMYGRLLKEFVNAGDFDACESVLEPLRAALSSRWGLDLDAPGTMPLDGPLPGSLDDLYRVHPFNLATLLYMTGMLALARERNDAAAACFAAAAKASDRVRSVLRNIGSDDGETEELGWRARARTVALGARKNPDRAVSAIDRLAEETNQLGERMPARILADLRRDVFVTLVGDSHHMAADRLAAGIEKTDLTEDAIGVSTGFALGILELNHRNSPKRAMQHFGAARERLDRLAKGAHEAGSFVWVVRYNESLAALKGRERAHGKKVMEPLLTPDEAYGTPDPKVAERVRKLARDYGLSR